MKTIKAKLIFGFALVLILTFAVGSIGFYQIYVNSKKSEAMIEYELEFSRASINLQRLILQHRRYEKDFLLNSGKFAKQDSYLKKFDQAAMRLREEVHKLRELAEKIPHVSSAERKALETILADYERYYSSFRKKAVMIQARMMDPIKGNEELSETKDHIYQVEEAIRKSELGDHVVRHAISDIIDNSRIAEIELAVLTSAAVVIGLIISFFIFRSVEIPLRRMVDYADHVSNGDWDAKVDVPDHGEMGHLKQALQALVATMKNRLGFTDGILKGMTNPCLVVDRDENLTFVNQAYMDLYERQGDTEDFLGMRLGEFFYGDPDRDTVAGEAMRKRAPLVNNEIESSLPSGKTIYVNYDVAPLFDLDGELIGAFAMMNDLTSIRNTLQQIEEKNATIEDAASRANHVADQVASASEQLSAQIEQSSAGAERQRENASGTATAMEEMNATVYEVAKNASGAAEMADKSRERAQQGAEVVDMVVETIKQVHGHATELKTNMDELGQQAESITKIMNVITDIADQTNLLALNAAIEAARAGEAGRGFAVVADEVRKLAEKTMQATKEVGDNIGAIQNSARKSITGTEQATQAIDRSTELADQSGAALSEIVTLVENTADQVRNIATAAEEQSSASEEVTRSTEDTSQIATEMAQAMAESNEAVTSLAKLAQELKVVIEDMQR
ncbi:methyl-accepting chemotaxis protein [Salidesulfovibrio brasiliensis]|uniref:methyl-accepting chemotaxis protein n=1 Tax=Salidesulfovibrio brasiliensis TaxID=221711 RepID=UPI0006D13E94|nr:methyl-accepting chemotaxis protein [Salidesulfovibrio brasiliensis]